MYMYSAAGSRRNAAGRLLFDSRSAVGSLAYVTSALALFVGWNARKRARGIYVGQEYHRLARWTNGAFCETNVCSCSK